MRVHRDGRRSDLEALPLWYRTKVQDYVGFIHVEISDLEGIAFSPKRLKADGFIQPQCGGFRARYGQVDLLDAVDAGCALHERLHEHSAEARAARPLRHIDPMHRSFVPGLQAAFAREPSHADEFAGQRERTENETV